MKFNRRLGQALALLAACTLLQSPPARAVGGDHAGNGGSFLEGKVITFAYEILDALKALRAAGDLPAVIDLQRLGEVLKVIRIEKKINPTVGMTVKDAVNYPEDNLLLVDEEDFEKRNDRYEEQFQLVLHELLPLAGAVDKNGVYSVSIMKKIRARELMRRPGAPKPALPVLLFSEGMQNGVGGMEWESASRLCELEKRLHSGTYYFVYCTFIEKTTLTVRYEAFEDRDTDIIEDHFRDRTSTRERSRWKSLPVTHKESEYGLRVFGLGKASELPWKVVGSSLGLAGGSLDLTYEKRADARQACYARLAEADPASLLFYKARCRTPQLESGRFYYEIVTQNPLIRAGQN